MTLLTRSILLCSLMFACKPSSEQESSRRIRTVKPGGSQQVDPDQEAPSPEPTTTVQEAATFRVQDGKLLDPTGTAFIMRGVNNPHNYYYDRALDALPKISNFQFNTVRVVWCADTLLRSGRCDPKDMHSLEQLEAVLKKAWDEKLVVMLTMQNATGSDSAEDLALLIDWYVRAEVVALLQKYQNNLIINIANEWIANTSGRENLYVTTYKSAIRRMRSAGLSHVIVVDAPGWGQDFQGLLKTYEDIQNFDKNVMFSSHMYELYGERQRVSEVFGLVRQKKIPYLVGEFACQHKPYQKVDCDGILEEAAKKDFPVGYIGWSYSGNNSELSGLDVTRMDDWSTLSSWGERLVNGANGIRATSQRQCLFGGCK